MGFGTSDLLRARHTTIPTVHPAVQKSAYLARRSLDQTPLEGAKISAFQVLQGTRVHFIYKLTATREKLRLMVFQRFILTVTVFFTQKIMPLTVLLARYTFEY